MAPPKFADLSKAAADLFKDDFGTLWNSSFLSYTQAHERATLMHYDTHARIHARKDTRTQEYTHADHVCS